MSTSIEPRRLGQKAPTVNRQELSPQERARLKEMLQYAYRGIRLLAEALLTIRDEQLWRADADSFEDFCEQHIKVSRSHIYRTLAYAKTVKALEAAGIDDPTNEGQLRPLVDVPEGEQADVYASAKKKAGGKVPTGAQVADAAKDKANPKPKEIVVTDVDGTVVDDTVAIVSFDQGAWITGEKQARATLRLLREMKQAADAGEGPSVSERMIDHARDLLNRFQQEKPVKVCGFCTGGPKDSVCAYCHGRHVLTKEQWHGIKKDM